MRTLEISILCGLLVVGHIDNAGAEEKASKPPEQSTIELWKKQSVARRKKSPITRPDVTKPGMSGGTPGELCHIGSCAIPPDGTRDVCYFNDQGSCEDCRWEYDTVCDPL